MMFTRCSIRTTRPLVQARRRHWALIASKRLTRAFAGSYRTLRSIPRSKNLTDPLNWATLGTAGAGEDLLRILGEVGTRALKSPNAAVRTTAENALTNVAERQGGFKPSEISAINTIRQKGITRARVQRTMDADLLRQNAKTLKKVEIPDAVRQRLLREAYVDGTSEMREQAVSMGYRPSPKEEAKAPTGLLAYNLRHEYSPGTGVMHSGTFPEDALLGQREQVKAPKAGFVFSQTTEQTAERSFVVWAIGSHPDVLSHNIGRVSQTCSARSGSVRRWRKASRPRRERGHSATAGDLSCAG